MIFKGPQGFARIMNIVILSILCTVFSAFILFLTQHAPGMETLPIFTPINFIIGFIESFAIGYVVGDLMPIANWNQKLLTALHVRNKIASAMIGTVTFTFIFTTILSFSMSFLSNMATLGWEGTVAAWWATYPVCLVVGYIIALFATPLATRIAAKASGFDPTAFAAPAAQPQADATPKPIEQR